MTSGWILCLAVVSQTSWGMPSAQPQWQASPVGVAQQPQQTTATSQFATSSRFGGGQTQPNTQFAMQSNGTQPNSAPTVDQYGRSLINSQNVNQQTQQPWQNQQPQTSQFGSVVPNNQQPSNFAAANGTQYQQNNQNIALNPSGVNQFGTNNQQPTNWPTVNSQQGSTPQFAPPQNQAQSGWPNQQQPQQQAGWPTNNQPQVDPRTGQTFVGNQQNPNVGTWPNVQQSPQNSSNFGGQFAGGNQQTNNQLNNSWQNPQINGTVDAGNSRFGAQISLGDNRFRVASNANAADTNSTNTTWGQQNVQPINPNDRVVGTQNNNQPALGLQPPAQATLPAGSNQQQDLLAPNLNPHQMTQPPRVGESSSQGTLAVNDTRWSNLQQPSQGDATNQTNAGDLQPVPAGQVNNAQQPTAANANTGQQQLSNQQSTNSAQGSTFAQGGNQQSQPNSLYGSTTNGNNNTQPMAYRQYPQQPNMARNAMLAALNPELSGTPEDDKDVPTEDYTPSAFAFGASLVFNFLMVGGVLYLGWIAFESHFRYRRALLDGDDYDDRGRDDDRGSRRR